MKPKVKHPNVVGLSIVFAIGSAAMAIGLLAGWSEGALGVTLLTAGSIGVVVALLRVYEV